MKRSKTARTAALAAAAAAVMLSACGSEVEPTAPATTTVSVASPVPTSAPASPAAPADDCAINPSTAQLTPVEPYGTVAQEGRITVALTGIPSGALSPGGAPTEVDVRLCNDSAVDHPAVGVVLVLGHCSCASNPTSIPAGTVERFDTATGEWIALSHPVAGTGMDYLGGYANVHKLSKGAAMTLRYRIALDASMTAGEGTVEAVAVVPEPLNRIGSADLAFAVID